MNKKTEIRFHIEKFDELDSTNTFARQKIIQNPWSEFLPYNVILCRSQVKGRGTGDHTWVSLNGNIFMSVIFPLSKDCPHSQLSVAVGTGIAKSLMKICNFAVPVSIKWPNDVLMNQKKVSGVLIEIVERYVIVGIGINLVSAPKEIISSTYLQKYVPNATADNVVELTLQELSSSLSFLLER
ncbi:MAG: biotin--[acetyl-CoA-carboxylase] ligase [Holosporales bacterium]|nr:biotin--[acetyl-CoA-carboxylase] ligase [Holosporales bacterium]